MNSFSSGNRGALINQLSNSVFDVLIIGGGITGAGIALDATARGLKVALVEMADFSSGTSGKSTKLIHGGLRYLKQFEFSLVAEVGKEREIIHQIAPHLTKPEPMLLPIVKNGSLGKYSSRLGMWLYERLAGVKKEEKHQILDVKKTLEKEPLLREDNLLGGILFYEYRTDDSRLTIEVLKEAVNRGAIAVSYMKVTEFIYDNERISGVKVNDQVNGMNYTIKAEYVVNAAGPWIDELDDLDKNSLSDSDKEHLHKLHITKGVHIVIDRKKLPVKQSVYFDTSDKRMIFVIPREGKTYIGTTDTFYEGDMKKPEVKPEDKNYLLKNVNAYFPDHKLNLKDIESSWAGIRPLIQKPGKGPSEISRKDEIFLFKSGLITIAGGKLTAYRKMAERTVNIIAKRITDAGKKNISSCSTDKIQLSGGKIITPGGFPEYIKKKIQEGYSLGLTDEETTALVNRFGSNVEEIFNLIKELNTSEKSDLPVILRAQLRYAIEKEMCLTLSDFFVRRTGMLYFNIVAVKKWNELLLDYMEKLMKWDSLLTKKNYRELQNTIEEL